MASGGTCRDRTGNQPEPVPVRVHWERESSRRAPHHGAALATWNSSAGYFSPEWPSVSRKDRLLPARGKWQLRPRARATVAGAALASAVVNATFPECKTVIAWGLSESFAGSLYRSLRTFKDFSAA